MEPVEEHDFYHCISGLIYLQILGGGRIQRPISDETGKLKFYAIKSYCILCNIITCAALLRTFLSFGDFSVETGDLFAYSLIALYLTAAAIQLGSILSYHEILPFWDSILSATPRKFNHNLRRPKIVIWFILFLGVCSIITFIVVALYYIIQPGLDPVFIRLAKPWDNTPTEVRISCMVTLASFVPSSIAWISAFAFFNTGAYYLRAGFIALCTTMEDDLQIIAHLSTYRHQHLRLCKLTATLDEILRTYLGASIVMSTFDMCSVIFTLNDDRRTAVFAGSIFMMGLSFALLLAIALMSISINSWVITIFICC